MVGPRAWRAKFVPVIKILISVKKSTSVLLLAVFIAVSAAGEGLHLIPGASHHGRDSCQAGHSRCGPPCHAIADNAIADNAIPDSSASLSRSREDCSICRFLAQSTELSTPEVRVDTYRCIILRPIEEPAQAMQDRNGLFDARAPPMA
jgi:hypothetical protein